MLFSPTIIGAVLCTAGLSHGRTVKRSLEVEQEQVAIAGDSIAPLTITVQADVSASRPAEIAKLHLSISASAMSDEAARQEATVSTEHLNFLLNNLSPELGDAIDKWSNTPIQVQSKRGRRQSDMWMMDDEDSIMNNDRSGDYTARSRYTINFRDTDKLEPFTKEIASFSQARIEFVDWELTEEGAEAQKAEVRRKAIRKVMDSGEDYAKAFGVGSIKPVEFEEEYSYTSNNNWRGYGGYYDMDDVDLRRPDMETTTTVKCKFSVG